MAVRMFAQKSQESVRVKVIWRVGGTADVYMAEVGYRPYGNWERTEVSRLSEWLSV